MKVKKSYTKSAPKKRPVFAEITEINEAQTMENEETIQTNLFDSKYKPELVKFRESEENEIKDFLRSTYEYNFLMVTGQPGSGKTMLLMKIKEEIDKVNRTKKTKLLKQKADTLVIYRNAMNYSCYYEYAADLCKELDFPYDSSNKAKTKSTFSAEIKALSETIDIVLIIDEFDHLFSKSADKDPYDLFIISQSPDVKIIGISNDIEFLQSKSKKLKLNLPLIRNIILKPYSKEQLAELVKDRIGGSFDIDEQALMLLTSKAYNEKGGDMRNVLDICKKILRGKQSNDVITKDHFNQEMGVAKLAQQTQSITENLSIPNQLILLAFHTLKQSEVELPVLIRKVNDIQFRLGLTLNFDIDECLALLKDYNLAETKETKLTKNGLKMIQRKVLCKLDIEAIQFHLQNVAAYETILSS